MKKLMTAIMMLSLILGGVALAAAADLPQVTVNLDLGKLQKISDQEAQQLRGTGGFQFNNPGIYNHINCPQSQTGVYTPIKDQTRQMLQICK
jgi:hypothetical protein